MLVWFALMTVPQFVSNDVYTLQGQSRVCYTTVASIGYSCLCMLGQCCGCNRQTAIALNFVQTPTADGC